MTTYVSELLTVYTSGRTKERAYTPFKLAKKQWMSSTVRPLFIHVHFSMKGTGNLREKVTRVNSGRTVDEVRARRSRVNTERTRVQTVPEPEILQ